MAGCKRSGTFASMRPPTYAIYVGAALMQNTKRAPAIMQKYQRSTFMAELGVFLRPPAAMATKRHPVIAL